MCYSDKRARKGTRAIVWIMIILVVGLFVLARIMDYYNVGLRP